ncbi:MAG: tRNA pseudouridine(55) synthase TruB [Sedimentibacter sp.]|uniref:tRNA pseudouridine(55) synthase TruB n=1 Tax=Sedimentibacter sp. TaxID=1960295 RepID=UPI0031595778
MNGILNILKPTGMTSHDVVSSVRKILNTKKVGHAGTLDPNVAGVLVICVGKGTKLSDYLMSGSKEYVCELVLGRKTDTQDSYGKIVDMKENFSVSMEELKGVLKEFEGEHMQVPPAFSAVKLNGRKLYEYARQNIAVEKPGKPVDINEIELLRFDGRSALMRVVCSKGTYMRTLCNDIGDSLGTLGYMGVLVRTKAKGLLIENSVTLEELKFLNDTNSLDRCIIPIDEIYPLERADADSRYYDRLAAGNEVPADTSSIKGSEFYIYCRGELVGMGKKVHENIIKVDKMLL